MGQLALPIQHACPCKNHGTKRSAINALDAHALEQAFAHFTQHDMDRASFDLKAMFPGLKHPFKVFPGELLVVIGDTGINKTAFVQHLIVKLKHLRTLWFSLEVSGNLMYRRFVQIAHELPKERVIAHYKASTNSLSSRLEHIDMVTQEPIIADLHQLVNAHEPQIVVVDTIDGVETPGVVDATTSSGMIGKALKVLAMNHSLIVIAVQHVTKSSVTDQNGNMKALTVHSGKGAGTIEQKADKVIAIEGMQTTNRRRVRSLKARDEHPFSILTTVNMDTFTFSQIPDEPPKAPQLKVEDTNANRHSSSW